MRGLEATFDRRLLRESPRPLAVGLSGGGDSLALTLMADDWAREAGRDLLILTVDHGLQAESAAWTQACAATAERIGRPFRALAWEGAKPSTGLPAAARAARHRLLAEAAREIGASVLLMGHTADDIAEAQAMRAEGATTPDPREWSPSPVWPGGRGIFVFRPLLDVRRAELRGWLRARGETWIEDPANADLRYARSRARASEPSALAITAEMPAPLADGWVQALGVIRIQRSHLRDISAPDAARLLALASVCAGGGGRLPAAARINRLVEAVRGEGTFVATLAGARIDAAEVVHIAREPGEARRGGLKPLTLPAGQEVVWDGRFAVTAYRPDVRMRPIAGIAAQLPQDERRRLAALPPGERGGLPAIVEPDGRVTSPVLSDATGVEAISLVGARLRAAAGLVTREPQ